MFELAPLSYPVLQRLYTTFTPVAALWATAAHWNSTKLVFALRALVCMRAVDIAHLASALVGCVTLGCAAPLYAYLSDSLLPTFTPASLRSLAFGRHCIALQVWMMNRFLDLEADAIVQLIQTTEHSLAALAEQFAALDDRSGRWDAQHKVLAAMEADLSLLSKPAPLLCQMLFRGIRPRHWAKISEIFGFEINADSGVLLETVLALDLDELCEPILAVCASAVQEYDSPLGRSAVARSCAVPAMLTAPQRAGPTSVAVNMAWQHGSTAQLECRSRGCVMQGAPLQGTLTQDVQG
jgi:hypothetical protein